MTEPAIVQRIRLCPQCLSERPLAEMICGNDTGESQCGQPMTNIRPTSARGLNNKISESIQHNHKGTNELKNLDSAKNKLQKTECRLCSNGHEIDPEDEECLICGEPVTDKKTDSANVHSVLPGWQLIQELPAVAGSKNRFVAKRIGDNHKAVITLFREGAEPDRAVYDILQTLDVDHIARLEETGRHQGQAYEITEYIRHGTLRDFKFDRSDLSTIKRIIEEISRALSHFNKVGLRHRDLTPNVVTIRTLQPLDLVIEGFGSACLSEYDLDVVAPLENTIYMAPEAIAGGVTPSSDWWSLGMILLEKLAPDYLNNVNPKAFLIQVLTVGVQIPTNIDPELRNLLSGLLLRNREHRFGFDQVRAWLDGETVPVTAEILPQEVSGPKIKLGDDEIPSLNFYALRAAEESLWEEAKTQLISGKLASWAEDSGLDAQSLARLRATTVRELNSDFKLGICLKILNKNMPLVQAGDIVTPKWLLNHPELGYELITGDMTSLLEDMDMEPWLVRLRDRAISVRRIAKSHSIELDEDETRIYLLSASRTNLLASWEQRRGLFPDTWHSGLASIVDHKTRAEEDLIILLSADIGQFQSIDDILSEANALAEVAKVTSFKEERARRNLMAMSRREIFRTVSDRTANFARCGNNNVDEWVDQFRLERRTTLPQALVMLEFEKDQWQQSADHVYVSDIVKFFETKVQTQVKQGPLARMRISKSSARIDLFELDDETEPAEAVLNKILERSGEKIDISNHTVISSERLPRRIRKLVQQSTLYRRETGIDGLHLGFPFIVLDTSSKNTKPRIAPVLLWPVKMTAEVGRDVFSVSFDTDRHEIRLNPALEGYFGPDEISRWHRAADELLAGSVTLTRAMDEFGKLANPIATAIQPLPNPEILPKSLGADIYPTGVLFLTTFMGQAIVENLRDLTSVPATETALAAMLRLTKNNPSKHIEENLRDSELDRYLLGKSDPSQEEAVKVSRKNPGTVIKGPPGTGKSQTLTHIVADCLGRGESVLICTQKQAALEVVRKRLVAEGLQSRIMMVEDVHKDRQSVIKSIREHQQSVRENFDSQEKVMADRRYLAAQIAARDWELAENHKSLFEPIGETGRSYRDVIAELVIIEEASERPVIDCPQIRPIIQDLPIDRLVDLEERVVPLVPLWLDAEPQKSANENLKPFGWEKSNCDMYREALEVLFWNEQERLEKHPRPENLLRLDNIEKAKAVLSTCIQAYPENQKIRAQLSKWIDLLNPAKGGSIGESLINQLTSIRSTLNNLNMNRQSDKFSDHLLESKKPFLEYLQSDIDQYLKKSLTKILNPWWWSARSRVRKEILIQTTEVTLPQVLELRDAVSHEYDLFDPRQSLIDIAKRLSFQSIAINKAKGDELVTEIEDLVELLQAAQTYVVKISGAPDWAGLKIALQDVTGSGIFEYATSLKKSIERFEDIEKSRASLDLIKPWLNEHAVEILAKQIDDDINTNSLLKDFFLSRQNVEAFQRYRATIDQEPKAVENIFQKLNAVRNPLSMAGKHSGEEVRRIINREVRLVWKHEAEENSTALLLDQQNIKRKVQTLSEYDKEMSELNRLFLLGRYSRDTHGKSKDWEAITRLTGARSLRLREFISRARSFGLFDLKPVWLMNPDVAARMLPMTAGLFDVVIFDEASQLPIEYSLHVLYRGKRVIVSGDEKQMPPTAFFQSKIELEEAELEGGLPDEDASEEEIDALEMVENSRDIKDCSNMLALASSTLPVHVLEVHYRSKFRELIAFSNAAFYNNSLNIPVRHPESLVRRHKPIEFIQINGLYKDQKNPTEALAIVDRLQKFWEEFEDKRPSVGIVTFNRKQAELIQEYIEKRAETDSRFRVSLSAENMRYEDGEDMSFFVKNVENVQGDERDVILFSSTFGKNEQGRFRKLFGVLGATGGERRLNVAVTRAREKVILFTSMPVSEISDFISVKRQPKTPRDYLQGYLEYARLVSSGKFDAASSLTKQLVDGETLVSNIKRPGADGFCQIVGNFIHECGFEPIFAADRTPFSMDIVIEHPKTERFFIGIECDTPQHSLLKKARSREIWRPEVIKLGIPRIHRVSSINWYTSRDREKQLLKRSIEQAFEEALE